MKNKHKKQIAKYSYNLRCKAIKVSEFNINLSSEIIAICVALETIDSPTAEFVIDPGINSESNKASLGTLLKDACEDLDNISDENIEEMLKDFI